MPKLVKSFVYIKRNSSNSHLSNEATTILSKTTVGRSAVEREDLKPNWKQKKGNVFLG